MIMVLDCDERSHVEYCSWLQNAQFYSELQNVAVVPPTARHSFLPSRVIRRGTCHMSDQLRAHETKITTTTVLLLPPLDNITPLHSFTHAFTTLQRHRATVTPKPYLDTPSREPAGAKPYGDVQRACAPRGAVASDVGSSLHHRPWRECSEP